jgi:hypothetical protein
MDQSTEHYHILLIANNQHRHVTPTLQAQPPRYAKECQIQGTTDNSCDANSINSASRGNSTTDELNRWLNFNWSNVSVDGGGRDESRKGREVNRLDTLCLPPILLRAASSRWRSPSSSPTLKTSFPIAPNGSFVLAQAGPQVVRFAVVACFDALGWMFDQPVCCELSNSGSQLKAKTHALQHEASRERWRPTLIQSWTS